MKMNESEIDTLHKLMRQWRSELTIDIDKKEQQHCNLTIEIDEMDKQLRELKKEILTLISQFNTIDSVLSYLE